MAVVRRLRPLALEILCASRLAQLQEILNPAIAYFPVHQLVPNFLASQKRAEPCGSARFILVVLPVPLWDLRLFFIRKIIGQLLDELLNRDVAHIAGVQLHGITSGIHDGQHAQGRLGIDAEMIGAQQDLLGMFAADGAQPFRVLHGIHMNLNQHGIFSSFNNARELFARI